MLNGVMTSNIAGKNVILAKIQKANNENNYIAAIK